jgi:hypothetical protein
MMLNQWNCYYSLFRSHTHTHSLSKTHTRTHKHSERERVRRHMKFTKSLPMLQFFQKSFFSDCYFSQKKKFKQNKLNWLVIILGFKKSTKILSFNSIKSLNFDKRNLNLFFVTQKYPNDLNVLKNDLTLIRFIALLSMYICLGMTGESISDVTQFWTFFTPPPPPHRRAFYY